MGEWRNRGLVGAIGLVALAVTAATWPNPLAPNHHPLAAYAMLSSIAIAFWMLAAELWPTLERPRAFERLTQLFLSAVLAFAVLAAARYVVASRPWVGGFDFFYYVNFARDMRAGEDELAVKAYGYFPGVYAFWRTVLGVSDGTLAQLQTAYLLVLVANSVVLAALLARLTGRLLAATFGAVWYLVICSRFEGLLGVTEPLATLPVLLGLLVWAGRPLRGRSDIVPTLALGIALGVGLYFKQQAGLLSLGALALLGNRLGKTDSERRHAWWALLSLPLIAATTFTAGVLAEGRGWLPLRAGLGLAARYAPEGSWLTNLYQLARNDESTALAGLVTGLLAAGLLLAPPARVQQDEAPVQGSPKGTRQRVMQVGWFALLAACACLIQYRSRGYYHYALLLAPFLVVADVLFAVELARRCENRQPRDAARLRILLVLAAGFPLFYTGGNLQQLRVWILQEEPGFEPNQLWHRLDPVARDLELVAQHVAPGETTMVFPPRQTATYFLLGTRAPAWHGYRFAMPDWDDVDWSTLDSVVVFEPHDEVIGDAAWDAATQRDVEARLRNAGFERVVHGRHLSVWSPN